MGTGRRLLSIEILDYRSSLFSKEAAPPLSVVSWPQLRRYALCIVLLAVVCVAAQAQAKARAHLDSTYILIGDQVQMQLFLDSAVQVTEIETDFSVFDTLPFAEVIRYGDWNQVGVSRANGTALFEQRLVITSFEAGRHVLPPIPIRYKYQGESRTVFTTGTTVLEVGSIAVDDQTQLVPIKGIIEEPTTFEDFLPWLLGILAVALVVALAFLIYRLTRPKPALPPPTIVLKPHEVALQKLEALGSQQLWQQGQVKAYQTELTFIIREYLEQQFQIPALENTTDEIIASLQKIGFDPTWQERLRALFQNADLVKFAKAELPASLHEAGMKEAIALVWETRPVEMEASEVK
jgi:hypothetical protein